MGWPVSWLARLAITSLMFMFDEVAEPVWNTSTGKWASRLAVDHLLRDLLDEAAFLGAEQAEFLVGQGAGELDQAQPLDEGGGHRPAADREN